MKREDLRSRLSKPLREDSFEVFGDPAQFMTDPFCSKCGFLLKDDERTDCRRCARIRIE